MQKKNPKQDADGPLYPIASVDNALRLLLLFRTQRELRLSEAAGHLNVANSTAHRLLAMLQHHGFVRQDSRSKAYLAGPALIEVGLAVVRKMDIREVARPILEEIAAELGETSHVAVRDGSQVRYLDAVESDKALRVAARTGMTLPAHCTSIGKALLADSSPAQLRTLYPDGPLPAATDRSITSLDDLERELDQVRRQGYAVNTGESEEGVSSVAVAVRDRQGIPLAAISCAAPSSRMPQDQIERIATVIEVKADRLGKLLTG